MMLWYTIALAVAALAAMLILWLAEVDHRDRQRELADWLIERRKYPPHIWALIEDDDTDVADLVAAIEHWIDQPPPTTAEIIPTTLDPTIVWRTIIR